MRRLDQQERPAQVRPPVRLGAPCWTPESAASAINGVAQVDRLRTHFFSASHAPIRHLEDANTGKPVTEEALFQALASSAKPETLAVVKGGPGTGKSHLINWLKLRFDAAAETGERKLADVLPVLVQRRSGSLRDALEQILLQLPPTFQGYLDPVRLAIERISEQEARQKLAAAMYLELAVRWNEEERARDLPRDLRNLPEAFRAEGFSAWLCRLGGAIDLSIKRLIDPSDVRDREDTVVFSPEDFLVSDPRFAARDRNSLNVVHLMDALQDDDRYPPIAAEICNRFLRPALNEITGLGSARLTEIFAQIRTDLKAEGRRLAVFIEDVSTMSVLDREVINALEPQNDSTLCPLISVVGMTEGAFSGELRANQQQRATMVLSLGSAQSTSWRNEADAIDQFVARYLNTARLTEPAVREVAAARRGADGQDVTLSACEVCPIVDRCHEVFGAVQLGSFGHDEESDGAPTKIGMFPFAPSVAHRLLGSLDEQGGARVERTPRGLLDFVVDPMLKLMEGLEAGAVSRPNLPLKPFEPAYWAGFRQSYCGGWPSAEVARLKLLAEAWVVADRSADAAAQLEPMLQAFGLPAFTMDVAKPAPRQPEASRPRRQDGAAKSGDVPERPLDPAVEAEPPPRRLIDPRIPELAAKLEAWVAKGETLQAPQDAQKLLLAFVRSAMPFEDLRRPPARARKAVVGDRISIIRIEGAATRAATERYFIDFERTEETRDLLVALAHYEFQGNRSWDFEPDAQIHKRTVARWLRHHQDRIAKTIDPPMETSAPIRAAASMLGISALVERRTDLPKDTPAAVEALLEANVKGEPPRALSNELSRLYADLRSKRNAARDFLFEELDVPQGSGGCNFIDPWPIVDAMTLVRENASVYSLSPDYLTGHWQSRYVGLSGLKNWGGLADALEAERRAIKGCLDAVREDLMKEGYLAQDGVAEALTAFFRDLAILKQVQKTTKQVHPSPEFDRLFKDDPSLASTSGDRSMSSTFANRKATLAAAVAGAEAVMADGSDRAVLMFDSSALAEARQALAVCAKYIAAVRLEVDHKLSRIADQGDPDDLMQRVVDALDGLIGLDGVASAPGDEDDANLGEDDVEAA